LAAFDWRDWLALAVLGCGSSALATLLFTVAFTYGRPNTPVLLQQLQPFLLLRERVSFSANAFSVAMAYICWRARRFVPNCLRPPLSLGGVDGWHPRSWQCRLRFCGARYRARPPPRREAPFAELTALRLAAGLVAAMVALG